MKELNSRMVNSIKDVTSVLTDTVLPKQKPLMMENDVLSLAMAKTFASDIISLDDTEFVRMVDGENSSVSVQFPHDESLLNALPTTDSNTVYSIVVKSCSSFYISEILRYLTIFASEVRSGQKHVRYFEGRCSEILC